MDTIETPNPLPADHAEEITPQEVLHHGEKWAADLINGLRRDISSQAEEIERLRADCNHWSADYEERGRTIQALQSDIERITKERDEVKQWFSTTNAVLYRTEMDRDGERMRAEAAESSLSSMTERCKELEWQPMSSAPLETPIEVKMETDRIAGGVWVATAILHEDADHWTDGATVLHYNGNKLVGGFRGPLTGWRSLARALSQTTKEGTE